ncbi:acetamidase/formamidase family protein [Citricoccus sp. K5]|uniref:acetamidase/formamidase family protein n=1 Tax=Citricoccus sp. K5 TaxID=2653135 RepID=UPI0012F10469|nr:acetamidase/formamidase family protein [Citricoccus sp. K5]VXB86563.1 Acetamidase [Citricoccus sp. K5]
MTLMHTSPRPDGVAIPARALQPGSGPITAREYLPATAGNVLWGRLPCEFDKPVLTVDPGTEVTVDTISHEGVLEDQGRDPVRFFAGHGVDPDLVLTDGIALAGTDRSRDPGADGPHVVTGPICVRGAEPGDLLSITVLETLLRVPYGVISSRHGRGALAGEYPLGQDSVSVFAEAVADETGRAFGAIPLGSHTAQQARFPLHPFLGTMGVAVRGGVRPHSVPPGRHGGNLDINLLTAGSTLHLPVQVSGALAYLGDPHFAQGDGEVALTAMEASLRVTVRFDVVDQGKAVEQFGALVNPLAETTEFLVPTGLDEDLDAAVRDCVRSAITLLQARYGMEPHLAYAYLSAATDFNVSQVVDVVKGVHARIRRSDFPQNRRPR